jgi:hypothetical protein
MDRKENSRKRTQSAQRKFGLSIAVIRRHDRPSISPSPLRSLRSFAAIHFERGARRTMATAVLGGVTRAALGAFPACMEPRGTTGQSPLPITEQLCGSELLP